MTVKERMQEVLDHLPEDADFDEALERIFLAFKVHQGITQADAGQTVSHEEAKKRMSRWLR